MADFVEAKVREIEERLQELRPLIDEFRRLEAAVAVLNDDGSPAANGARAATANGASRGRRRGRRGENTRATQTIELVRAHPGITIAELAKHMGIKPNYLYRVLPQLVDEGKIRREGKGWYPA